MRKDLFDELIESVREMKAIQAGHRTASRVTRAESLLATATPNVAALRARFRLSQAKFSALLGISVDTLQNWEQKRREPDGPARVLLRIAATHPEALLAATPRASKRGAGRSAA
jgi:putative transcriptional regulator